MAEDEPYYASKVSPSFKFIVGSEIEFIFIVLSIYSHTFTVSNNKYGNDFLKCVSISGSREIGRQFDGWKRQRNEEE